MAPLSSVLPLSGRGAYAVRTHLFRTYQYYARDRFTCALCRGYTFYLWLLSATDGWLWPVVFAATGCCLLGYSALVGWVLDPCCICYANLSSCAMLYCAMLYYAMLCCSSYAMLCYAMYAMLCYAYVCYAMLCYVLLVLELVHVGMCYLARRPYCRARSSPTL
jgi:hypothetical protein